MNNIDAIFFYFIVFTITILFLRIVLINIKVRNYIKKFHRDFWEENILSFSGGGYVGLNIFQLVKGIDDPKIIIYKNKWDRAIKHFLLAVLLSTVLTIGYIILSN